MENLFHKIGDHVDKVTTWNPKQDNANNIISYIDLSSVNKIKKVIEIDNVQKILSSKAPSRAKQIVNSFDILVSTVRPNLNGVARVPFDLSGATASTGYCVLRAKNNSLDVNYLFYWLQSKLFIDDMVSKAIGANYPAVSDRIIKKSKIPLPPLPEQKKIAAIIDAADSLRQKDQQLIDHYTQLSQSLFLDMFGDVLINNKGFKKLPLKQLVNKVQIGPFGSQLHKHDYIEDGIPLVNPVHIKKRKIVPNNSFTLSKEKFNSLPNYHLITGDLVMGRRGEMGRCAVVTEKENNYFCGTGSLYIRPNNRVNSIFLLFVLSGKSGKSYLERNAQGVTMMNLNKKIILNFELGVPSVELQNSFANSIKFIEKQHQTAQDNLKKSEDLFNSLLQKAFKGELTSTNNN